MFILIIPNMALFLWMLLSFLIGYFLARNFYKTTVGLVEEEFISVTENEEIEKPVVEEFVIRAKKTFDRGGVEIKYPKTLDFSRIGTATEANKNTLTEIKGIGAFIEQKLNSIGIYTFKQIANITEQDIEVITELIQFFPGRIKRDNWKEQAEELLKKEA